METDTTVADNFNNHPVQMGIKTVAAIALLGVGAYKAGRMLKSKLDSRKVTTVVTPDEIN